MSSWERPPLEYVKRTLVSWSKIEDDRVEGAEGAELVDWVDQELEPKE